jgi:predicted transcriptional regulator
MRRVNRNKYTTNQHKRNEVFERKLKEYDIYKVDIARELGISSTAVKDFAYGCTKAGVVADWTRRQFGEKFYEELTQILMREAV